jgi:hypothetical protein
MQLADATYNVSVTRGTKMLTAMTMSADNYYITSSDNAHLSKDGYEAIGRLAVNQLASVVADRSTWSNVSSLTFDLDADDSSFVPGDLDLSNFTTAQAIQARDISVAYDAALHKVTFTFPGLPGDVLPAGDYEAVLHGVGGATGEYVYDFTAVPLPEPAGAGLVAGFLAAGLRRRRRD